MQREEIEEIVRQVVANMNGAGGPTAVGQTGPDEEYLLDIDYRIDMVRKYHSTLRSAVAAVIPNEEPHGAVLIEINRWLSIARAAQIGQLRNERNVILPYTSEEIDLILNDGDILDLPSDGISLAEESFPFSEEPEPEVFYDEPVPVRRDWGLLNRVLGSASVSAAVYVVLRGLENFVGK